jgi:hypothetical protein
VIFSNMNIFGICNNLNTNLNKFCIWTKIWIWTKKVQNVQT